MTGVPPALTKPIPARIELDLGLQLGAIDRLAEAIESRSGTASR